MKDFINTHDKAKGSFPTGELSEEASFSQFDELEAVATPSESVRTPRMST